MGTKSLFLTLVTSVVLASSAAVFAHEPGSDSVNNTVIDYEYSYGNIIIIRIFEKNGELIIEYNDDTLLLERYNDATTLLVGHFNYNGLKNENFSPSDPYLYAIEQVLPVAEIASPEGKNHIRLSSNSIEGWKHLNLINDKTIRDIILSKGVFPFAEKHKESLRPLLKNFEKRYGTWPGWTLWNMFKGEKNIPNLMGYLMLGKVFGGTIDNGRWSKFHVDENAEFLQKQWGLENAPFKAPYNWKNPGAERILVSGTPLIVSHASTYFDEDASAQPGIEQLVSLFHSKESPIIYLVQDNDSATEWMVPPFLATLHLSSDEGENNLFPEGESPNVFLSGGHFSNSLESGPGEAVSAAEYMIHNFYSVERSSEERLNLHLLIPALYFHGSDGFYGGAEAINEHIRTAQTDPRQFVKDMISSLFSPLKEESEMILTEDNWSQYEFGASWYTPMQTPLNEFRFAFYVDNKRILTIGRGKLVHLRFYSDISKINTALIEPGYVEGSHEAPQTDPLLEDYRLLWAWINEDRELAQWQIQKMMNADEKTKVVLTWAMGKKKNFPQKISYIQKLIKDPSIAVRKQAIYTLSSVSNSSEALSLLHREIDLCREGTKLALLEVSKQFASMDIVNRLKNCVNPLNAVNLLDRGDSVEELQRWALILGETKNIQALELLKEISDSIVEDLLDRRGGVLGFSLVTPREEISIFKNVLLAIQKIGSPLGIPIAESIYRSGGYDDYYLSDAIGMSISQIGTLSQIKRLPAGVQYAVVNAIGRVPLTKHIPLLPDFLNSPHNSQDPDKCCYYNNVVKRTKWAIDVTEKVSTPPF